MNDVMKTVGKNLKIMRKANKITQDKLAKQLGINIRQVARIESGDSFISAKTLEKLCQILKIHPADLFNENIDAKNVEEQFANKNYMRLKEGIEKIASDNSKIEFMNFAIESLSNEDALKELQLILKGFELRSIMQKG